jgi:hypothetical protein
MKTIAAAVVSASLFIVATAAAKATVKLTGISHAGGRQVVLVEIDNSGGGVLRPILAEGEQIDGVEVVSIDPKAGTASLKQGDKVTGFSVAAGGNSGKVPTVNVKDADSRQVLDLYQQLSGRTVIASPALPAARVTVRSDDSPVGAVARALSDSGIAVTLRSDKFAFATRPSDAPRLAEIAEPPAPAEDPNVERFPPGLIKFAGADQNQVLDIYQELTGRTVLKSPVLPPAKFTFKSQTVLTRDEAVWLVEAALQLGGIAATRRFDKFAFATALSDAPRVARIKEPPAPANDSKADRYLPGLIKFADADVQQVLDIYQHLGDRTVLKDPALPHVKVTVRSQTELTRDEALWLLESALQLGGIRFVPAGDNQVKVISETSLNAANN